MSGSGFSSINTAVSGLHAAQRSLDATGQNIVNVNTPGYSRQRVLLSAISAPSTATVHSGTSTLVGGVRVADVTRIHNVFTEATRAAAGAKQSAINGRLDSLGTVEVLLSEPGDNGIQSTLDSFFNAWQDLADNVENSSAGSVVIQSGGQLTDQLHSVRDGITAQWLMSRGDLEEVVAGANQAASDLAKVNAAIEAGEAAGQPVNEMRDTQDVLVRRLASLVGASATTDGNGRLSVSAGGITFVSGNSFETLKLTGATGLLDATSSPLKIMVGNYAMATDSGEASGLLAVLGTDLPGLADRIDKVATSLITVVNKIYSVGFAKDGSTGASFFSGTNAHDIAVVPTKADELQIAQAANISDGSVALAIGDLADDATAKVALGEDGPSAQWRDLTTALGVQVQSLLTAKTVQDSVVSAADDAVTSESGVSLDEEMTNLMQFQRAYQASARVITTVDELLDTLINRTGRVGL